MKLSDIKPFVRYSKIRGIHEEFKCFSYPLCACDCRLLFCFDGEGKIIINGEEYDISYGTLLLWRSGIPYTYVTDKSNSDMKLIGVNFDYTWDYSHITLPLPPKQSAYQRECLFVEAPVFDDAEKLNGVVVLQKVSESFHKKLLEINSEFEKKKNRYELKCSGILLQLLAEIAFLSENGNGISAGEKLAESIIDYLANHYSESLNINAIGANFGYHPNYLNQIFIKYTGKSVYAYLQELRITQAIRLLETSNMSISEIGAACGFADRAHFSRYFKQKTGRTPKAFRP